MLSLIPKKVGNSNRETFAIAPPLARLREFDTIFNRLFAGLPLPYDRWPYAEPYVDIEVAETEKEFLISLEAPGFEANDFDVRVTGNVLTVTANHAKMVEKKKEESF